jgi:hypothetical protein
MALTIDIEGKGVIANADAEVNDTGGDGTGDWGFSGSGGVAWGLTTDTFLYGSSCMAMALSGAKNGWMYFDIGSGNELDFDVAGTEEGQHIYFWIHCPTIGLSESLANVGVGIRIGSSTSDYRTFTVAGNDGANGWNGGWKCFVIDPTKAGSISDGGTFDVGAVRYLGIRGATTATAKGDNFFIDQIAVGSGLRITGTSAQGWQDAVEYCTDYANRAWGMLQEREGIYYAYGMLNIGDAASQSADVSFADSARVIQFGVSEYYYSSAWVTSADVDYSGINIEDHSSYQTDFTDGIIVGSDNGRSGSVFIGNLNHNVSLDLFGGNNASSDTLCYGTTFKNLTGALNSGNDSDHKFLGCSFIQCEQFDPVGAPVIRNCTFAETVSANAAILWNESIDIQYCNFIANTESSGKYSAGIEHPSSVGTPYGHVGLQFSGNDYDVYNSSGYSITINNSGNPAANGSTSINDGSDVFTTFLTAIDLIITVQDKDTNPIVGARVGVYKTSNRAELMNEETIAGGIAQQSYNGGATAIEVRVRDVTGTPKYKPFSTLGQTGGSDYELLVTLEEDPNA